MILGTEGVGLWLHAPIARSLWMLINLLNSILCSRVIALQNSVRIMVRKFLFVDYISHKRDAIKNQQCIAMWPWNIISCSRLIFFQERQQFHLEQLRAAEFRARASAQTQLTKDSPSTASSPQPPPPATSPSSSVFSQQGQQPPNLPSQPATLATAPPVAPPTTPPSSQ